MKRNNSSYLVYRSVRPDIGQFYIGCIQKDSIHERYFGSGAWPLLMKRLHIELKREILCTVHGRAAARLLEAQLIRGHWDNPLLMNVVLKGMRFRPMVDVLKNLPARTAEIGNRCLTSAQRKRLHKATDGKVTIKDIYA